MADLEVRQTLAEMLDARDRRIAELEAAVADLFAKADAHGALDGAMYTDERHAWERMRELVKG